MERAEIIKKIADYYFDSEKGYLKWGRDEEREGIYAVHCGFTVENYQLTHFEEVRQLSRELTSFSQVPDGAKVLDAGCGAGALSFELADCCRGVKVFGVNIAFSQLVAANRYKLRSQNNKVYFSKQDYHQTAFPPNTFDIVIFCESFTHSYDKRGLFQEVFRILKPNGRIVLSDIFTERATVMKEEQDMLEDTQKGWYLPSVLTTQETVAILKDAGFSNTFCLDCTKNIIESARRIRQHTEQRMKEGDLGSDTLQLSRRAVVACSEAVERGLIGYYFVRAIKPLESFG